MKSWTISKLHLWEDCGLRYALENEPESVIARFPGWELTMLPGRDDVQSPAAARGEDIHKLFENYVRGSIDILDPHKHIEILEVWQEKLDQLREYIENGSDGGAEVLWQFDDEWYTLEAPPNSKYGINYDAWHRQKLDAWFITPQKIHGVLVDYKTGKMYPQKHDDAMEVYALGMFAQFDELEVVTSQLWYVDQPIGKDNPLTKEFTRAKDAKRLAKRWEKRAQRFLDDERFIAKPGVGYRNHCSWCPYSARKGGPCQAG